MFKMRPLWRKRIGFQQLDEFIIQEKAFGPRDILFINLGPNDYLFDASADKVESYMAAFTRLVEKSISHGGWSITSTPKLPKISAKQYLNSRA